jgi:hypothetical protein
MNLEVVSEPGQSPCCDGPVWSIAAPVGPFRFCGRCGSQVRPGRLEQP